MYERGGIQAAFDKRQGRVPLGCAQLRIGYRPINECAHARLLEIDSLSPFPSRPAAQGRLIPARLQKIDFTNANRSTATAITGTATTAATAAKAKVNGVRHTDPRFDASSSPR